ncbi:MAG: AraC family transcriptional regulator [Mycobacteriaceae bacterium]|nr:AraC family transcriptional regulator [Mycobacteriaceae bacterium]
MTQSTRLSRHRDGVPVYRYRTDPGTPPVSVVRYREFAEGRPHIHDFPALWYVPDADAVYVAAPGKVLHPKQVFPVGDGIAVFFDPVALGQDGRSPWPAWQTHPLLFPFLHGQSGGVLRLKVPTYRKELWDRTIASIESELAMRQPSYRQATMAHLTLLLIELARLAGDIVDDLRRSGEPLLADVFAIIERRQDESLSLRDVASEVGMTPGHLTTVVRRRTGRTVQAWIIERRMAEARDLLAETDLPVGEIARRVGINDAGYFSRLFSRAHGRSPRQWRAGHTPVPQALTAHRV